MNYIYTLKKKVRYQKMKDVLTKKLIIPERAKSRWSLTVHRQLSLLLMWTKLSQIDINNDLKSINMKTTL